MKRCLIIICVCLLLGAIANVAVAWGAFETSRTRNFVSIATSFCAMAGARPDGKTAVEGREYQHAFNSYDCIIKLRELNDLDQSHDPGWKLTINGRVCTTVRIGWPARTLHGQFVLEDYSKLVTIDQVRRSIRSPEKSGFAINTLFYAAILWLLWFAPGRIRRFIRIRRGQCPSCGYVIAPGTCADGLCSECGKPVSGQQAMGNGKA